MIAHTAFSQLNITDYPSYPEYERIMQRFQTNNQSLCRIINIGKTINGRNLLFAKISRNVDTREKEPILMYSSSIHGNETTGYALMLKLIDYLLNNYNQDSLITDLINNTEIWINPLANPDGTYRYDTIISNPSRENLNGYDLNRNFPSPDPVMGNHPDDDPRWEPETQAFMSLAMKYNFTLSVNFHTGSEVVNYPWDYKASLHPDDSWYHYISKQYADTVHKYSSDYMTDLDNGITNGYQWYQIFGGFQDYMNYFAHSRDVTIELSHDFDPPYIDINNYWEYNYRSMLNYIKQTHYGIKGTITDSLTGKPLKAIITVLNHDTLNTDIYSDSINGYYHRMIYKGKYDLLYYCAGYHPKIVRNIIALNNSATTVNVQLSDTSGKVSTSIYNIPQPVYYYSANSREIKYINPQFRKVTVKLYNLLGTELSTIFNSSISEGSYSFRIPDNLPSGIYLCNLMIDGRNYTMKIPVLSQTY
ncbi:MAG: M14 family zinc carboxypeptidase [Bacteroidota bacterium]|nr:M14 family zinc carboxypeptidase [Bacteroidota bacterium]